MSASGRCADADAYGPNTTFVHERKNIYFRKLYEFYCCIYDEFNDFLRFKLPLPATGINIIFAFLTIFHNVEKIMALKDLSDEELRRFIQFPKEFLSDARNYEKVFDLTDPSVKARVERYEKEMSLPPHSLQIDRPVAAK